MVEITNTERTAGFVRRFPWLEALNIDHDSYISYSHLDVEDLACKPLQIKAEVEAPPTPEYARTDIMRLHRESGEVVDTVFSGLTDRASPICSYSGESLGDAINRQRCLIEIRWITRILCGRKHNMDVELINVGEFDLPRWVEERKRAVDKMVEEEIKKAGENESLTLCT